MKHSKKNLMKLYESMLKIRFCEEKLVEPILRGEVKTPCHLCSGQEAVAAGVCLALDDKDYVFGNHRSHGHYLAKGGSLKALVAEIYGKETGCSKGRGGSMHIVAREKGFLGAVPIVSGTVSLAVGSALASKINGDGRVSVSFFGDGATGEGVLYESMNFASLKKLPVIFVCENNLYSTHMPIKECRKENDIFKIGRAFSMPSYRVDGNDVLKVHSAAKKALSICRKNAGPVFIECMTYRLRGHVGPDDCIQGTHTDIREEDEINRWQKKDCIRRFEKVLKKAGILEEKDFENIRRNIEKEVQEAFNFAANSSYPHKRELGKHVF